MKRKLLIPVFLLLPCFFYACTNDDRKESGQSENDIDAARNFIRAALDGKFDEARSFLLQDSSNVHYIDAAERNYQKAGVATRDGYRAASINIHGVNKVNDSATIVIYSNSFMKNHDTLRVMKAKGQWMVDLTYLYEHNADTLYNKINSSDTLK